MDESMVAAALEAGVDHITLLYKITKSRRVFHVFEKGKRCLEILQAYLRDSEYQTSDGKRIFQVDRGACKVIASKIQDVLDEFMYKLLQHHLKDAKFNIMLSFKSQDSPLKVACRQLSECIKITDSMVHKENIEDKRQSSAEETCASDNFRMDDLEEEEAIGFETYEWQIIKQLMEEETAPSNIGIIGMGGCGKTTLAKMVYNCEQVKHHFPYKAWVKASHPNIGFHVLLNDMLSQFGLKTDNESAEAEAVKVSRLREYLHDKRYLIVIDEIWRPSDWKAIQHALPKYGKEGSRVVLITRNSHIISSSAMYVHDLSGGLSNDNARKLFRRKVSYDNQLESPDNWPEKFVNLCEGLPLALTTLGTWLSTMNNAFQWKEKYNDLGCELGKPGSDLSVLYHNLQLSFSHLPSHLRSCFLYLSEFPEGQCLSRERLLRLWIAEGFVMPERGTTMEQTAEGYLNELVARNLIVVTSREGYGGRVKRCRLSHLVHKINISRHKSFATAAGKYSDLFAGEKNPSKPTKDTTGNYVRTFLTFEKRQFHELENVFKTNKFLKVLDLNGADLNVFPRSILRLYLLKYLCLSNTKIKVVPNSICNLLSLETLDLKDTLVWRLPKEIGKLQMLRHLLLFKSTDGVRRGVEISAKALRALSSIQKLWLVKVDKQLLQVLGELIGIRKLGLTDLKKTDGRELCASIENMQNLSTLDVKSTSEYECLDLNFDMRAPPVYLRHLYLRGRLMEVPKWISSLASLSKIGLTGSKLELANPLESIEDLPNLMELELEDYYIGEELKFKAKKFLKLVMLSVIRFEELKSVIMELGALPSLRKLVLLRCNCLKELSVGIDSLNLSELLHDRPTLQLKVYDADRQMVKHNPVGSFFGKPVIRSYTKGDTRGFEDLSPSVPKASTSENKPSISLEVAT